MEAVTRYNDNLSNPRSPGEGCHSWIMSTSNYGVIARIDPQTMFEDIRRAIPSGSRRVPDREIQQAISKALADHKQGTFTPQARPAPIVKDGQAALRRIIEKSPIKNEADLWEASPIRLLDDPQGDPTLFLRTLFNESDLVFIGERHEPGIMGDTIRTVKEWLSYFENGGQTKPFIIINPLSGLLAPKESGDGETLRGNGNVVNYRYCLVEFDNLNREDQIRFWSAIKLPAVALIDSGNKSIHGWLDAQKWATVATSEEWEINIKNHLYDQRLTPLGLDGACSNPARLSRLPGHFREEKGNYQRLLWLAPEGRPIWKQ